MLGGELTEGVGAGASGPESVGGARLPDGIDGRGWRRDAVHDPAGLEGGAEGCGLGDDGALDGEIEDVGAELAPAVGGGAASDEGDGRRLDAGATEDIEAVGETEGDAFEDGPKQVVGTVADAEAGEEAGSRWGGWGCARRRGGAGTGGRCRRGGFRGRARCRRG